MLNAESKFGRFIGKILIGTSLKYETETCSYWVFGGAQLKTLSSTQKP